MGYIYKIENIISNKIYIGQTTRTIEERWKEHCKATDNYKIHQAMRKYGINNFSISLLEEISNDQLNEREIYWIDFYNSYNNGYNGTKGGSDMSNIELQKKPVEQRDLITGELIQTFSSLGEAGRFLGDFEDNIRKNIGLCCQKKMHQAYGYRWNFVGDNPDTNTRGQIRRIPIIMCDKITHQPIKEFDSAKTASKYLNKTNGSHITACCKGKLPSAYGYYWKYKIKEEE